MDVQYKRCGLKAIRREFIRIYTDIYYFVQSTKPQRLTDIAFHILQTGLNTQKNRFFFFFFFFFIKKKKKRKKKKELT
jgi:hypothetical protein